MKQVSGKINRYNVTITVIETGEKHSQVRKSAGIELDDEYTLTLRGEDFDDADDLRSSFPGAAVLIESAGINLDNVIGYFGVINS